MNKLVIKLLLGGALLIPAATSADGSCIGLTLVNPETYVTEQGPVQYMGCSCSCNQYSWTETGMCPMCLHKHADGTTFGQKITFDNNWIKSLIAYTQKLNKQKKKQGFIGAKDVYGNPDGGGLGDEGIPGDWWGEGEFPSQGAYGEDETSGGLGSLFGGGSSDGGLLPGM